jgi:hypothetical protein
MWDALPNTLSVCCSVRENVTYLDALVLHRALRKLEFVIMIAVGRSFPMGGGYGRSMLLTWVGRFKKDVGITTS